MIVAETRNQSDQRVVKNLRATCVPIRPDILLWAYFTCGHCKCSKAFAEGAFLLVMEVIPTKEGGSVSKIDRHDEIRQQMMKRLCAGDDSRTVSARTRERKAERLRELDQIRQQHGWTGTLNPTKVQVAYHW
jgi:hypothetical protein